MDREELVRTIRRIAREECAELLDEHLSDYIHVEKPFRKEELEEVK